jgi:hypothetical protein
MEAIKPNILNIYFKRKRDKIDAKYDKEIEKIVEQDEYHKLLDEANTHLKEILSKDNGIPIEDISDSYTFKTNRELFTTKTREKLNKLSDEEKKEKEKLINKCEEVNAQIELTDTYEDKIFIYMNYGILNKNRKINA